jgi:DNA-binding CsgD family transcriptional regulator
MKIKRKYRVVIIEPSVIVQKGLENIIANSGCEFETTGVFSDFSHYSLFSNSIDPDIFLVNPGIIAFNKKESIRNFLPESANRPVAAILYMHISGENIRQFSGYVDIYDNTAKIIEKLRMMILKNNSSETSPDSYDLSEREREILISVTSGNTNKEIASNFGISVHTVMSHRKNIIRKTGIKSVSGLTVYAFLNGLIDQ